MSDKSLIAFIEAPLVQNPTNINGTKSGSVTFDAILQTANEKNRNNTVYPLPVLQKGMDDRADDIRDGLMYGELDHPVEHVANLKRIASVMFRNASHRVIDYGFDGNILRGTITTLQATDYGKMLRDLILLDNAKIGISMRGFGEQQQQPDGSYLVTGPLTIVTYDVVCRPSHPTAFITKISPSQLAEAAKEMNVRHDTTLMEDSTFLEAYLNRYNELPDDPKLISKDAGGVVCFGGKCYLLEHLDKMLSSKIRAYIESVL